jgi:Polyketide cyclase / dehydrase and lipid transport
VLAHFEVRIFIPASPEAVWAVLGELERHGEWMVDIRDLAVVSEQKRGVGTIIEATSAVLGLPVVKDLIEVTVWEPDRRMDVRRETPPAGLGRIALRGTGSFILDRIHNGTILTWIEDFQAPFGLLGEVGFAMAVRPHMRRVFGRSLLNLRRLAVERDLVGAAS